MEATQASKLAATAARLHDMAIGYNKLHTKPIPIFWTDGTAFLKACDESNANVVSLLDTTKQEWLLACNLWIMGIENGIVMSEQIRPAPPKPSKAQETAAKAEIKRLGHAGFAEDFSTPTQNMCQASDVSFNEERIAIVKWLKDDPPKLTQKGTWLVYVALKNIYACPENK